jgi:hypothetical protein
VGWSQAGLGSEPVDEPAEAAIGISREARIAEQQRIVLENPVLEGGAKILEPRPEVLV